MCLALERLMQQTIVCDDGRRVPLVSRQVHWQAIFRILVDRGIYPDGTDYRGFCCYMEEAFPTAECRVPLDYHSLKNISQTMFVRPFAEWRYDAATRIIELIGMYVKCPLSPKRVAFAMNRLGYRQRRVGGVRGYNVIILTGNDIKEQQRLNARESTINE